MFSEAFIYCINNHCLVVLKESELSAKKFSFICLAVNISEGL